MLTAALLSLCLTGSDPLAEPPAGEERAAEPHRLGKETITLFVGHKFSTAEAHVRVQQLLDYWKTRFGVTQDWTGERVWVSGSIVGVDFNAYLEVSASAVRCESTDPGGLWRGFARSYVAKKLQKYLHPLYAEP